ncbi:GNS1/SUR4 family domain-containing protein [Phthorimaea operculella]|nr:GNS1/SUR4 family domain-containing protein [Phthorimaea operculella]
MFVTFIEQDKVSGFWTWMFVLSKLPELGDTVFIVLRKKPLIFLHWYHHITVLLYTWYSFTEYTSSARWFVVMNYCVHSVMYTYFALVSMGKYPPKMMAMTITLLQLTQMIVGCFINVWAHNYLVSAPPNTCGISQINIKLSMAMYFSYFVLFAQFFYKAYLAPKGISQINIKLSMAMYFSYFVLFAQFFYKAYLAPKGERREMSFLQSSKAAILSN